MKIYVGHSKDYDFKKELYIPLRISPLDCKYEIILPHENSSVPYNSKELMKSIDFMIAEVSLPSTGLGIELGWADMLNIPILAVYKKGSKLSQSVKKTAKYSLEYGDSSELIRGIESILKALNSKF